MLKYQEVKVDNDVIQYKYFPEGKAESGVVSHNKTKKEFSFDSIPNIDKYRTYALKMVTIIREFIEANSFNNEGIVDWY